MGSLPIARGEIASYVHRQVKQVRLAGTGTDYDNKETRFCSLRSRSDVVFGFVVVAVCFHRQAVFDRH